jgi:energy-coupling factor transporter ATP-binding protein EcfA2
MSHFQTNSQPYVELKSRGRVQQFSLTQDEHRLGRDRQWADFALPDEGWDVLSGHHAVFRRNGTHYWIYDGDGTGKSSTNGTFARQHFDRYRSEIGYVPQDDIIHQTLTVEEVLTYACQLRLPPDTDIPQAVGQVLHQVQLNHVRQNLVQNLSGGQRKHVSIAVELLANPKLFFLDEPTSGLDPGLDKTMMNLLRELANQGRTIILVTHATSNLEVCDRSSPSEIGDLYHNRPHHLLTKRALYSKNIP